MAPVGLVFPRTPLCSCFAWKIPSNTILEWKKITLKGEQSYLLTYYFEPILRLKSGRLARSINVSPLAWMGIRSGFFSSVPLLAYMAPGLLVVVVVMALLAELFIMSWLFMSTASELRWRAQSSSIPFWSGMCVWDWCCCCWRGRRGLVLLCRGERRKQK